MVNNILKKEAMLATLPNCSFIIGKKNIIISKIILEDKIVSCYKTINIKKAKRVKRLAVNMYLIEDDKMVYYALSSNDNEHLDSYIAISDKIPVLNKNYNITRLIYNYGTCFESPITTSPVKNIKKITRNLYKVKTKHTYYVLVN